MEFGILYRMGNADVRGANRTEQLLVLGLFQEAKQEIIELRAKNRILEWEIEKLQLKLEESNND